MRNLRQPADAAVFLDALLPAYKLLPLESQLKARMAFLLGLLATAARSVDLAETLHLEAVLCLDRLPCASIATASAHEANHLPASSILLPTQPILTRFGVHALERLGDALIKNGKYEYGIFALERAIECFSEVSAPASATGERLLLMLLWLLSCRSMGGCASMKSSYAELPD
jgi:hypothetical protein